MRARLLAAALVSAAPAVSAGAADVPLPLTHGQLMQACLQSGGMTGYYPSIGSADVYQIGAARKIDLSILTDQGNSVTVNWVHPGGKNLVTTLHGSTTMSFSATSVKLQSSGAKEVSWCAHVQ